MRLSPKKIEHLAQTVCQALESNPEVALQESSEKIGQLIRQIVTEDMRQEEEIETEARRLLEEHMTEIQRKGVSFDTLLRKTKAKLAQERKIVL